MADKENSVRRTRLAASTKKRGASTAASASQSLARGQPPAKRTKRKALGELKNISNVARGLETASSSKPRTRSRAKKEAEARKVPPLDVSAGEEVHSEAEDPQMCSFYAPDIYEYLRSMEVEPKRRPLANFIEAVQKDVTANMRGILVDWLVEVAEEYKLFSDTLYLTVSHIDRFLSHNALSRKKLQLLGVSCMFIASKYEEINPPHVEDFCYITDNTYTKQEVVKMESDALKFLNFEMGNPTIKTFLRRFVKAAQEDGKYPDLVLDFLSNYLAELSLIDYGCVRFLPSVVAASAVFVARFSINPRAHPWSLQLQEQTGYKLADLKDCIYALHDLQLSRKWSSLTATRDKYRQHRFKCVSTLLSPLEIPVSYLEDLEE